MRPSRLPLHQRYYWMMEIGVPSMNASARGSVDTVPGCDSHSRVLRLEHLAIFEGKN